MAADRLGWSLLINMNVGLWGVQLGNGLQIADASAIFESLGAEASQLPLLWLGAPLVGLLVQPVVGELSDRTWVRWAGRWGRRQPYFLGGALLAAVMLAAMPLATRLSQAVAIYWVLQLALNISIAPARPFVGDLLPPASRTLGYALQGVGIGLGAVSAAGLPWLLGPLLPPAPALETGVPAAIGMAYWVGAALCLVSALWTFWAVDEPALPGDSAPASVRVEDAANPPVAPWRAIAQAVTTMPPIMRDLAGVQALTWAGVYCIFLYLPNAIALNVLAAPSRQSPSYAQGIAWAGVCIACYNLVCLGVSFLIPALSRRWGRVTTHALCLMAGAVGLVSLLWVHSPYPILLSMAGVGIAWASILSIPYSLLMDQLSEAQSGVYMGLFNGFVTLPQVVMSLGFGWVMKTGLHGNRLWALVWGGILLGLAALAMLRVAEPTPAETPTPLGNPRALDPASK
ncbi:MAG TPA: MFS transporter [Nodosilinea sp.]|nr:MFS transporter [Nodosilinea sp.]